MRIIVFSDSHGDVQPMDRALSAIGRFDAIIHLGDIDRDVQYLENKYREHPVYAVLGNNEFAAVRERERVITLDGVNIFMCHGHTRGVNSGTEGLRLAAESRGCTVALFGHTHRSMETTENGILIFNPGSCSRPRMGAPSFGVLEIDNGKCSPVVVDWIL